MYQKNWSVSECLSPWNVGSIFSGQDRVWTESLWKPMKGVQVSEMTNGILYMDFGCLYTIIHVLWFPEDGWTKNHQIVFLKLRMYWWFTNGRSKTSPPQIQVYRLYSNQPCLVSSPPPSPTFRLQLFQGHVLPEFGRFGYQWRQETFGRGVCWWFQTSWTSGKFDYVPGFPRYRD